MTNKSIAIVDDEQDLVDLFSEALKMHGYSVCSFTNPVTAYEQMKQNLDKYALLIGDYKMPHMSGTYEQRWVKNINKEMNVIIMSAYDDIKCNFKFLRKPLQISTLIKVIENDMINPISDKIRNNTKF